MTPMDHSAPILSCPAKGPAKTFKKNLEETSHEKLHTKSFNGCSYFIRIGWIVLWPQHTGYSFVSGRRSSGRHARYCTFMRSRDSYSSLPLLTTAAIFLQKTNHTTKLSLQTLTTS